MNPAVRRLPERRAAAGRLLLSVNLARVASSSVAAAGKQTCAYGFTKLKSLKQRVTLYTRQCGEYILSNAKHTEKMEGKLGRGRVKSL